ncbi:GtrA family protein [Streptococcus sp. sy018]|uniref:GtrA family protein n=1 Tax=Streptococcus sp. sy018 TaxID=2600147 RepID=UPI0011B4C315|nr:GtrA family protein [Streptococcus sp. sy018]TWS95329.1 GtrA family protein [Streptococcus sp. sy018]
MKKLLQTEAIKYLIFGVLATLVYMLTREIIFYLTQEPILSAIVANITAVLFAFITNDLFVFNQAHQGRLNRFGKFLGARLATLILDLFLAWFFVTAFPQIIGQFVNDSILWVNRIETLFSQVFIIVLNYFLSKFFIFKNKKQTENLH